MAAAVLFRAATAGAPALFPGRSRSATSNGALVGFWESRGSRRLCLRRPETSGINVMCIACHWAKFFQTASTSDGGGLTRRQALRDIQTRVLMTVMNGKLTHEDRA